MPAVEAFIPRRKAGIGAFLGRKSQNACLAKAETDLSQLLGFSDSKSDLKHKYVCVSTIGILSPCVYGQSETPQSHHNIANENRASTIVCQPRFLENRGNIVRQILQKSKKAPMVSTLFHIWNTMREENQ